MSSLFGGRTQQVIQPASTQQVTPDLQLPVPMQVLGHYLTQAAANELQARSGFWGMDWTQFFPKTAIPGQVKTPGMHAAVPGANGYPTWGGHVYSTAPGGVAPAGQMDFASMLARDPGLYTPAGQEALGGAGPRPGAPGVQPINSSPTTAPAPAPQPGWSPPPPQPQPQQPYNATQRLAQAGVGRMNVGGIG